MFFLPTLPVHFRFLLLYAGFDWNLLACALRYSEPCQRQFQRFRRSQMQVLSLNRQFSLDRLPEIKHEMKAVGHLHRLRCAATSSLRVAALTVTAHHHHFRVLFQPHGQ